MMTQKDLDLIRGEATLTTVKSPSREDIISQTKGILDGAGGEATVGTGSTGLVSSNTAVSTHSFAGHPDSYLTDFVLSDSEDNGKRRAWMQVQTDNVEDFFKDLTDTVKSEKSAELAEMLRTLVADSNAPEELLTKQYTQFMLTAADFSNQERMQIMKTSGDTFAATFTGKEPKIATIQGHLVNDYSSGKTSWFMAFLHAYEYVLRGSKLAKYRCKLKISIPDHSDFIGYVIALNTQLSGASDIAPPFTMSILIVDRNDLFIGEIPASAVPEAVQAEDVYEGSDKDRIDNGNLDELDEKVKAMLEQEGKLTSTSEYHEWNALRDRIQNGDPLTPDELKRYNDLTTKQENSGKEYALYDDLKREAMGAGKEQGVLPEKYYDDLRDAQERRYNTLRGLGVLTPSQQQELDKLEKDVGPITLYRDIKDKQSSGATLSVWERVKLEELEKDINTGVSTNYVLAAPKAYSSGVTNNTQTSTPIDKYSGSLATAQFLADTFKYNPLWNTPLPSGKGDSTSIVYGTKQPLLGNSNLDLGASQFKTPAIALTTWENPIAGSKKKAAELTTYLDAISYTKAITVVNDLTPYYSKIPKWVDIVQRNNVIKNKQSPSALYLPNTEVLRSINKFEEDLAELKYYKGYIETYKGAVEIPGIATQAIIVAKRLDTGRVYTYEDLWVNIPIDRSWGV